MCLQISSIKNTHFVFKYNNLYWGWKEFFLVNDSNHQYWVLPSMMRNEAYFIYEVDDGLLVLPKKEAIQPVEFVFSVVSEEFDSHNSNESVFIPAVTIINMKLGCHISKLDINKLSCFNVPLSIPHIEHFSCLNSDASSNYVLFSSFVCFNYFSIQMIGDNAFVVSKFLLPKPELLDNFISDVFNKFWEANSKLSLSYSRATYKNIYEKIIKGGQNEY